MTITYTWSVPYTIPSGYNLPRFWEVKVFYQEECEATNTSLSIPTCYNITDVVKTSLRQDQYYIAVSITL